MKQFRTFESASTLAPLPNPPHEGEGTNRSFGWVAFLLAILFSFTCTGPLHAADSSQRPNILIVMTDDQGLGDFSFTGNPVLKTPNFDAFARESVRLTDFHVSPMCTPTRGQLLTGLSALRNGATSVTAGRTFLRPGITTLPEHFAAAGYATGIFGKWHLGDNYPHRPMDRGFQEAVYHLGWGQLQSAVEFDRPLIDGRYFHNGVEKNYKGHCTDFWFDSAMDWMKTQKEEQQPFLCYLPTNAPHAPHIDLAEYIEPYKEHPAAKFFGMIAHLDKRFGDLDKFLTAQGLRDNTIVIFMTDNGGTNGVATHNAGLRAGKTTYYDGGHRVPCWIRWPAGNLGASRDIDLPTQNTDLFPTLCTWCKLKPPQTILRDKHTHAGDDLSQLFQGNPKELQERILVVQYGQTPVKHEACVIWNKWRLVKGTELYDVSTDRAQTKDVAKDNPIIVEQLRDYYDEWWQGVEKGLNDFVPQSIGAKEQPVVELTSGEWEGIYADNSGFVRQAVGGPTGGTWHIKVETPGEYEFTLRRWPEISGVALGDKYEPNEKSPGKPKQVTKGFPGIAKAAYELFGSEDLLAKEKSSAKKQEPNRININSTAWFSMGESPAEAKQNSVSFKLKLTPGTGTLKAWFKDKDDADLCGAFFVTVKKLPEK